MSKHQRQAVNNGKVRKWPAIDRKGHCSVLQPQRQLFIGNCHVLLKKSDIDLQRDFFPATLPSAPMYAMVTLFFYRQCHAAPVKAAG
jgi:hypothetical protein